MGRAQPDIHGLIEEGLTRYGRGDLDGALTSWQQVLALDPHHERALGYIDYVRMNHELLAGEAGGHGEPAPFPIDGDEPAHQIQAAQGELAAGSAAPRTSAVLDGWPIEEEQLGDRPMTIRMKDLTFTFGADDPDPELEPLERTGINFEDATMEYAGAGRRSAPFGSYGTAADEDAAYEGAAAELAAAELAVEEAASLEFRLEITPTPGFEPEQQTPGFGEPGDVQTPQGFSSQLTDVRPRELGFVQPADPPTAPASGLGPPRPPLLPPVPQPGPRAPSAAIGSTPALPLPERPRRDSQLSHDPDPPTIERAPSGSSRTDLISSLPTRRVPRTPTAAARDPFGTAHKPGPGELPAAPPSVRAMAAIPAPGRAPTAPDLSALGDLHDFDAPTERKDLRDSRPGLRPGSAPRMADLNPVISAPTRDLGLRPGSVARAPTDDDPTGLAEPSATHRAATARTEPATTRSDLVLPFDPIDARSVQILDAIDRHVPAPPGESPEDRTRRRITALFEHAIEWSKAGELDRAVAAIDLALSEDPNSALAQRLIQRHRETITNVFQEFLGDLNRTPILARPLHELAEAPISHRAAFLLSRVDGLLSIDEILDVSGMPRMEAYRYLCQLFLRGILR